MLSPKCCSLVVFTNAYKQTPLENFSFKLNFTILSALVVNECQEKFDFDFYICCSFFTKSQFYEEKGDKFVNSCTRTSYEPYSNDILVHL